MTRFCKWRPALRTAYSPVCLVDCIQSILSMHAVKTTTILTLRLRYSYDKLGYSRFSLSRIHLKRFTVILQHGFTRNFEILIENMIISYLMCYVLILVIKPYFLRKGMS